MASTDQPPKFIARQMALGFGSVAAVAVGMCALLLGVIHDVSDLVSGMRQEESAIRQGLELATAVREQSMRATDALIEANDPRIAAYEAARQQVRQRIQEISEVAPEGHRWRLELLGEKTQQMHEQFLAWGLPAARRGDAEQTRAAHRTLEDLGRQAATHADSLARAVGSRMVHAHVLATDATRLGLIGGGIWIVLVLALSIGFTLRLRAEVLRPLVALTEAARRFGRGDFDPRVGEIGRGEFAALSHAFDRMTEELAVREARLVQSERMAAIGQLAAGVAHELNNPIGIIRGYLKTMNPNGDAQTLREEIGILDEEASECQRIAEDLLSYARSGDLVVEQVEARALLEETAKRFQESRGREEDHPVVVEAERADLEADGSRLRQVVLNLLANASHASPAGAAVRLRGHAGANHYDIEVEDRGPGVDANERERIFEPFFTKRRGGSGLGLSVVHGIVKAHGGSVEALNAPGGGALFRVRLPQTQSARGAFPSSEAQ